MEKLNKLGYTKIEILVIVVLLGVVAFVTINKTSYAFAIDSRGAVDEMKNLIEVQAVDYAMDNLDIFKDTDSTFVSVDELVKKGYLMGDSDGLIKNPQDTNKNFNDSKVKLDFNRDKKQVEASLGD